ncbi:pseudouridine synthase [Mycoplasmopsis gallopavonis]|uniref:RNA pseudouridylate synthase n=1 Tax=Mycoplasmopsis gallopavonis TaxID=76629 RepID=A0A449AZ78_9BACT|nr:RluA family pseudouridine synthase [Mycoplasmopsis gallopavonis]RIV16976.1 RluA family pseudouridine synthase [Mycoplasmopsis gallopavonis]VEU72775.1 ribosomal large subunit pseudouridylate synthase C [Mycoplasmopsis gallopavonis]
MFEILATKNDQGRTLYKLLQKYLNNLPISKLEKIFRKKDVKVNGKRTNQKDLIINENDQIIVYAVFDVQKETKINKSAGSDLNILYEDDQILVIDKKSGIEVHGSDESLDMVVLNYLKYKQVDSFKPSHVGRLDKETSGIILYGKTYQALVALNQANAEFVKKYLFLSDFNEEKRVVELYMFKDSLSNKMKASRTPLPNSKYAKTILTFDGKRKIAELAQGGRKHQIRIALQNIGKPIYGDKRYGGKKASRLMLHSYYLKLNGLKGELSYLNKVEFYSLPKWPK